MPKRLIGTSLILIFIGMLPFILSFFNVPLQWPTQLPDIPFVPTLHGTESSAGIRSYAISNPSFPHDDTANQWFGESQMESYRALGFEITDDLLRKAQELKGEPDLSLQDVLNVLEQHSDSGAHAGLAERPGLAVGQISS